MLTEQVLVTNKLFKNGLINILLFLEVLNQELMLDQAQIEAQEKMLEVKAKKLMYSKKV